MAHSLVGHAKQRVRNQRSYLYFERDSNSVGDGKVQNKRKRKLQRKAFMRVTSPVGDVGKTITMGITRWKNKY